MFIYSNFTICIVVSVFAVYCISSTYASKAENALYKKLLSNYSHFVRPVQDPKDAIRVSMKVFLQQIINVDEKNQLIEINAWLKYIWNDYRLRWDPTKNENIESVRFPSQENQIWQPDILLYNSADDHFDSTFKSNMVVYSTGEVNWIPPGIFKVTCKMDITWFPFDEQSCYLKFGSWTYNGFSLDLQIDREEDPDDEPREPQMDLSTFVSNGEWVLKSVPAVREEYFYACCPEPYPTIRFYINIQRRTLFYTFNIILPSLLISLMTLMAFCLPAHDMSEKIGFQTTILLSVCFFLTVVSDMTPSTSENIPLLGIFFSTVTVIVAISTTFTITVLNLRYRQPANHTMSPSFRYLFVEFLPWLLLMKRPNHKFSDGKSYPTNFAQSCSCPNRDAVESGRQSDASSVDSAMKEPLIEKIHQVPMEQLRIPKKVGDTIFATPSSSPPVDDRSARDARVEKYMQRCIELVREDAPSAAQNAFHLTVIEVYTAIGQRMQFIRRRIDRKRDIKDVQEEWKFAAMALDRLCLVLFTAFLCSAIGGIFYTAPYLHA